MLFCKRCGQQNEEYSKYCKNCGTILKPVSEQDEFRQDHEFSNRTRDNIPTMQESMRYQPESGSHKNPMKSPSKEQRILTFLCVAIVIVAIAIVASLGIRFFLSGDNGKASTESVSDLSETTAASEDGKDSETSKNARLSKIYNVVGHNEASLSDDFADAVEELNIEIEDWSISESEEIPEDADAILINTPQSDISEDEREVIEEYLANGGKMLLITSPLQNKTLTNLNALMYSGYGVSAESGIVVEGDDSYFSWGTPYALLPDISSHSITSSISSDGYYILLTVAQGLTVSSSLPDGVTVSQLLTTSDDAFSKVDGYSTTTYEKEDGDIDGPFALAVYISDSNTGAGIVWIGSSSITDDSTNELVSGANEDFFLNSLSYLCD